NYNAMPGILRLTDESWEAFTLDFTQGQYALEIEADPFGFVWIAVDPARGGGLIVLDPGTGGNVMLNENPGTGALPSRRVFSLASDRDGNLWAGTDAGVCFFYSPEEDAVRPIFESRFLLKDETITDIEVDGGNRKWMATQRGVWLFNPAGDELVHNFTSENSPLPSNRVYDIAINDQTGEVFFATENGIASFRAGATVSGDEFQSITIFPNPVTADYSGSVGMSGLATDAIVKITDINGKLIAELRANGGTAVWNLLDARGRRPSTGIYLVFGALADGKERMVGKIAIID
ncbi:MAG TPA: two-component regulator propeller domain-containing protein, partial [Chryseosolibacter sp.]|nr:two-component regulator propeller domain-containing protein [Chryseosolibacter sp.]